MSTTAPVPLRAIAETITPTWRYLGLVIAPGIGSYAFNAVTVTLPQLRTGFGASDAMLELVIAGYGIPFAVLLILGGRLGDRFGRHRLFAAGMSLFLVAAIACSLAPGIEALIAARIVQGIGVAMATPQVLATIQATSTGAARVRAISAFSASGGIGAAIGQVLGGALASASIGPIDGWRATYWVAALFAALAVVLSRLAPRSRVHEPVAIDLAGTVELGAGILLISSALTFGPSLGWPWPIIAALVVGASLLVLLWSHQTRIERSGRVPLLPPSILRLRPLQLGLASAGLFFAGYGAILFVIPRALDDGLGVTPLGAGMALLPFALVFTVVSLALARIQRLHGDATLIWGVGIQVVALLGMTLTIAIGWSSNLLWMLQPSLVLLGVGQAMAFSPLTQIVVREVPVEAAGLSGGMFGTVQQLALSLGVIAIGGVTSATGWSGQAEFAAGTVLDLLIALVVLGLAILLVRPRGRTRTV
ncbi:MFS family permease [Microbacterium resistens]|uniref:MFS family permease n=1 Tax=Microbacterium resistens TaxID=156977 RepID=A0ABU1SH99_9MICO|nr:MFS transporter [Microbacterium resistens]MDR6868328.1 MFS family permease [Microbacterium resistens]